MTADNLSATLQAALEHHRAGRLREAEPLYRRVLSIAPNQPEALHMLGVLALRSQQPAAAVELIARSVALVPTPPSWSNLGEAYRAMNRLNDAVAAYRQSIALEPRQADAYANLGLALQQLGKLDEAEAALRQAQSAVPAHPGAAWGLATLLDRTPRVDEAVAAWELTARLHPKRADILNSFGVALFRADDAYRAISAFRRAIELDPNYAEAYCKLGLALERTGKIDEAIAMARRALELSPKVWQVHVHLGAVLEGAAKWEEAVAAYRSAIELNPTHAHLYGSLGNALMKLDRVQEAADEFNRGRELDPGDARFHWTLSKVYFRARDYPNALRCAEAAVKLAPHAPDAHSVRAFALLASGQFREGFIEYEWRWRASDFTTKPRDFDRPLWDGSNPAGRTILVHSEQGFGDMFQFLRYLPMLRALGAKVIVEVPYKLAALVRRMPGLERVVISGTILPNFDLHTPMLSLPSIFGTTLESVPSPVPYLLPDPALVAIWRERLGPRDLPRVGLVWAGSPKPDPARSAKLAELAAILAVPGIRFIAMQPEPNDTEACDIPAGATLINLGSQLRDFSDTTASVLANLDLLITIDTSVAHLAGAMGVRTWVLLPHSPDWRWMLNRSDSPWYPTVRLFRQPSPGNWAALADEVAAELARLLAR